jgi:hypothetical protein
LSQISLADLQCATLVNIVSLRPFKSAFVALKLFSASFTAFSFVGRTSGTVYPSTIDVKFQTLVLVYMSSSLCSKKHTSIHHVGMFTRRACLSLMARTTTTMTNRQTKEDQQTGRQGRTTTIERQDRSIDQTPLEFRLPGFRIPGVGVSRTLHHRSPESRNVKRRKSRKQETVSDTRELGMSRTLTTGVPKSRKSRNAKSSKTPYRRFGYRELEMSRTLTTGIPKLRSAKSQKVELTPFRSFADREVELSRTLTSRMSKSRCAKSRRDLDRRII